MTSASLAAPDNSVAIRHALQSVYYHSLGRSWAISGAPSVLLPPETRPMSIADALATLQARPPLWRDSVSRLVRSVPVARRAEPVESRYPRALVDAVGADWLGRLDGLRRQYRTGASLFAAALDALDGDDPDDATDLIDMLERRTGFGIDRAVGSVFGLAPTEFLTELRDREELSTEVGKLGAELGQSAQELVLAFADAAAFQDVAAALPHGAGTGRGAVTVFPVTTGVRQDTATLTTVAVLTTVVRGPLSVLRTAFDPRNWCVESEVVTDTRFVADAFTCEPLADPPPIGTGFRDLLVLEHATMSWGTGERQQSSFDQVLNTSYQVGDAGLTLTFALRRSLRSRILWDERPGGLLLDGGYVKVRPLPGGCWRIIGRKDLRFSDRTPATGGPYDVGQTVNYLTPAGLAWWSETELYKLESGTFDTEKT